MDDQTTTNGDAGSNEPLLDTHTATSGIPSHEELLPEHSPDTVQPPPPAIQKTPPPAATPTPGATLQGPFNDDIKNILKTIQLPERRNDPGDTAKTAHQAAGEPKNFVPEEAGVKIISETIIPAAHTGTPKTGVQPLAGVPEQKKDAPPSPTTPDVAVSVTLPTEKKEEKGGPASWIVTPLRTLREDLQHVITTRKISMVRAVALEEDKKKGEPVLTPQEINAKRRRRQHSFSLIFASGVLLFLGAAALVGVYVIQNQSAPQVVIGDDSSLIFAETAVEFPVGDQSPGDIKRVISQSQASEAALGSITRIIPSLTSIGASGATGAPRLATTAEFLTALGTHASDELVRALGDKFFLGIHTVDKNVPILVIPVFSYDHAFAGMLAWENTVNGDMAPIFPLVAPLTADASGLPVSRKFEDIVLRNYDVRALKDDSGTIQMYYSFPTPNLLIIGESPYTFTEVLSRLQAERKL